MTGRGMRDQQSQIDPNDPNSPALTFDEKMLASQQKEAARRGPPSRRRFLASAAATVGLPWLESLSGTGSKAQAASSKPVRLVAWHTPNGYFAKTWYPRQQVPTTRPVRR